MSISSLSSSFYSIVCSPFCSLFLHNSLYCPFCEIDVFMHTFHILPPLPLSLILICLFGAHIFERLDSLHIFDYVNSPMEREKDWWNKWTSSNMPLAIIHRKFPFLYNISATHKNVSRLVAWMMVMHYFWISCKWNTSFDRYFIRKMCFLLLHKRTWDSFQKEDRCQESLTERF